MLRSVLCRGLFENWGRCYCGDVLFGVSQIGPCFAVQGCLLREHKQCLLGLCRGCSGGVSAAQHAARCGSPIAEAGRGKTRLTHNITFPNCVPQISPLVLLGLYCFHHTIWVQLRRGGAAGAPAGLQLWGRAAGPGTGLAVPQSCMAQAAEADGCSSSLPPAPRR